MIRVIIGAALTAALVLGAHRSASAMVEFCPAELSFAPVGQQPEKNDPSNLFGFELTAFGPRTVASATVAFDTTAGWYTVDVPPVNMAEKDRHYTSPWVSFGRRDYVSPVMYIRFAQALNVKHAWVYSAAVTNDGDFGWQKRGSVACSPEAAASPLQLRTNPALRSESPYKLDPKDEDPLSATPTANSKIIAARASPPLEKTDCPEPFRVASVKKQAVPQYPRGIILSGMVQTEVIVAINPDGNLNEAWVWAPSGQQAFDEAALQAATASNYTGSQAYCKPAPGMYLFRVTFVPN